MLGTRSGNSYHPNQGLQDPGPSQPILNPPHQTPAQPVLNPPQQTLPPNDPTSLLHQLQQQMELVTGTLGTIAVRLDGIEEKSNNGEHRRGRMAQNPIGDVGMDDEEVGEHLGGNRYRDNGRMVDDFTRNMKVDVTDFNGKFDPDAFHDWMVSLEDYFEWFAVPANRRVRFVKLKLKGVARMVGKCRRTYETHQLAFYTRLG